MLLLQPTTTQHPPKKEPHLANANNKKNKITWKKHPKRLKKQVNPKKTKKSLQRIKTKKNKKKVNRKSRK